MAAEDASCIAFTANSTESLNIALKGTLQTGDHVITTVLEHNSVLRPLYECQEKGVELTILGCDKKGNISLQELEDSIHKETKAIVCTHGSNLTGNMIDIEAVGRIAKRHKLLLIVDARRRQEFIPLMYRRWGWIFCASQDIRDFWGRRGRAGYMSGKV